MFQYNEEDEYVANLMKSSNFPATTMDSFKSKKSRSNNNLLA
jgi:hypothetical protein